MFNSQNGDFTSQKYQTDSPYLKKACAKNLFYGWFIKNNLPYF